MSYEKNDEDKQEFLLKTYKHLKNLGYTFYQLDDNELDLEHSCYRTRVSIDVNDDFIEDCIEDALHLLNDRPQVG
jgi:hypothetical protein